MEHSGAGTTYPAANGVVARLVESGILHEFTGQARNRRFMYQTYIGLFHDSADDHAEDHRGTAV